MGTTPNEALDFYGRCQSLNLMEDAVNADINALLSDPLLCDTPAFPSVEGLDVLLEAERGLCLRLNVERGEGIQFGEMMECWYLFV